MNKSFNFQNRLKSMLKVDFRRMFTTSLFYIMTGVCLVIPVLIFVMTKMMDGKVTVSPDGQETVMEGFDYVWQALGGLSDAGMMSMDLVGMCNINMIYFAIAVLVCLFISQDFRSGYCKNLFTVRSSKVDYVVSKTVVSFVGGAAMIIAFFIGSIIGGAIAGISFEMNGFNATNIVMCLLSKISLVLIFVSIFVVMSIVGKQKSWLSLVTGFAVSMLLFTMIPMISPLDSTIMNFILSLAGGILFSFGLGAVGNIVLKKISLV